MAQVLIIDDDPAQLHVREAVLREAGFLLCYDQYGEAALSCCAIPQLQRL
jgi:hypothetical protein